MKRPTILVMGINHTYAPVAIREKVDAEKIFQKVRSRLFPKLVSEFLILSTCNRIEIYIVTTQQKIVEKKLQSMFPVTKYYCYTNTKAVKHLFYVSAGLDSMILGETEILAQIRQAYKKAQYSNTIGPFFHQLSKEALRVGKKTRNTTSIGDGITSVAQTAILLAKRQLGNLSKKRVLIIGAGDIAERIMNTLNKLQITDITVINRTLQRADEIVTKYGGTVSKFEKLSTLLTQSDLIISATSSTSTILSVSMIKNAMKKRTANKLCLIDLAVPRDIEESVSKIHGVYLYNIDDMQKLVNENVTVRKKAIAEVQKIIDEDVKRFLQWFESREAVPLLTSLTTKTDEITDKELTHALRKLSHLNNHDKRVVAILAKRLEGKILARPIANLKRATQGTKSQDYLALAKSLFEL